MENLDKKSNSELEKLRLELREQFEKVRFDVVKVYDYWQSIGDAFHKVNNEIKKRGLV